MNGSPPGSPGQRERRASARAAGRRDGGLAEVVSTFLLLAIAVGFAAGFSLLLLALPAPQAEPHVVLEAFVLPTATDTLVLEHRGGPALALRATTLSLNVGGSLVTANLGERIAAGDPKWSVVAAAGTARGAGERLVPGDQVRYTDAAVRGAAVGVRVFDEVRGASALAGVAVQQADTTRPQLSSARTSSATAITVNFTEALSSVAAADFGVAGHTVSAAVLLGDGSSAELTVNAMGTGETPVVSTVASPSGTRDLANNLLLGGGSVATTDGVAPTVSGVGATATNISLTITFTTSEAATGYLVYGPTTAYGLAVATASGTSHSAYLPDLTAGTVYHYKIHATDGAGNNQTGEPDRSATTLNATGGGGGGGGGGTADGVGDPPPHYIEFTTIPTLPLNPGIASGTFTITLRNTTGAAVTPASAVTVNLTTNSTRGYFVSSASGAVVTTVQFSGSSQATFKYVDFRQGNAVLLAAAQNVTPGSAVVSVTARGSLEPQRGDSVDSVVSNVIYVAEQDRGEAAIIGMNVLNPTGNTFTVGSVSFSTSPSLGTGGDAFFQGTLATGAGSDAAFSCTWSGSGTNTATCDMADFTLGAYGMAQVMLTFSTSNRGTDGHTVVTGTVTYASPSGATTTGTWNVRHEGSPNNAFHVEILALSGSGGTERAGFQGVTGGSANDFHFRFDLLQDAGTLHTKFYVPAGWRDVSVPSQSALDTNTASVRQPTQTEPGWVLFGSIAGDRDFHFRATPPDVTGLDVIHVESIIDPQTNAQNNVAATHSFGVAIV